jgi:hypothetical protein
MIRVFTAVFFVIALAPIGAAATSTTCLGSNPAIGHMRVAGETTSGQVTRYHLVGTVTNLGTMGQPSNVLQFVEIWHDGDKMDTRGVPPLSLGGHYNFSYDWMRASDAGPGTTTLTFRMNMVSGSNCNPANSVSIIRF